MKNGGGGGGNQPGTGHARGIYIDVSYTRGVRCPFRTYRGLLHITSPPLDKLTYVWEATNNFFFNIWGLPIVIIFVQDFTYDVCAFNVKYIRRTKLTPAKSKVVG